MKVSNKERSLTTRSAEMKKVTYPHCCLITALYLFVFTSELKFTKTSYQKVLPTDSQKKKKKKVLPTSGSGSHGAHTDSCFLCYINEENQK